MTSLKDLRINKLQTLLVVTLVLACFPLIIRSFPLHNFKAVKQKVFILDSVCDEILRSENLEPVKKFEGKPAPVNFSKFPEAKQFYTAIIEGASKAPNYSGHFTFISWGCGTNCFQYAIVDSVTGNIVVYHPEPVEFGTYPVPVDINSRLLVFNPKESYNSLKGKSLSEAIKEADTDAGLERAYYSLEEEDNGDVWLHHLCSENVLDGLSSADETIPSPVPTVVDNEELKGECDNYKETQEFAKPIPIVWTARFDGCLVSCLGASFTKVSTNLDDHPRFAGYYPDKIGKYAWDGLDSGSPIPNKFMSGRPLLRIYGKWISIDADHPNTVFDGKCVPVVEIEKIEIAK